MNSCARATFPQKCSRVIVGESDNYGLGEEAFLWTSAGGMIGLGDLPGGRLSSVPEDVSDGGAIVVGASEPEAGQYIAFFWSEATGMQPMDFLQQFGKRSEDFDES